MHYFKTVDSPRKTVNFYIRKEQQGSAAATTTVQVVSFDFVTTSNTSTNFIDLLAKRPPSSGTATQVTEELVRPEFLVPERSANGLETGKQVSVSSLKISKMENSISATGDLDPNLDRERFYIALNYPAATTITLAMRTLNAGGVTDDDPGQITLTKNTEGKFISPSLMLVPDDTDDKFPTGDTEPVNNERPHFARLGGQVQIDSISINGNTTAFGLPTAAPPVCPIPILRVIKCYFVAYTDTIASGARPFTQQTLNSILSGANRFLSQAGIEIRAEGGLLQRQFPSGEPDSEIAFANSLYSPGAFVLTPKAVKFANDTRPLKGVRDDFGVILCKKILPPPGSLKTFLGFATVPAYVKNSDEKNFVFCGASAEGLAFTLAHEIGHLLTNNGHFGSEYSHDAATYTISRNLMKDDGQISASNLTRSARLTENQVSSMLKNKQLQAP